MPTLHFEQALTPEGWRADVRISLAGDRIAGVETGVSPDAADERHAIGLPAIGNLHSHAFQRAMAGLAETRGESTDTFWTWRETMYRFALTMAPEQIEAVAAQLYVEMLEAGFGSVAEFHYLHNQPDGSRYDAPAELASRILAAAEEAGIGLTLLPVFYAHATFGGAPPRPEQRRFLSDLDSFVRLLENSRALTSGIVGVAPHSLRAVAPFELDALIAMAGSSPFHIHVAEQVKEVEDCLAWSGVRPMRWLLDHAPVDSRWCLVHATHMDDEETAALAQTGAVAGLCPVTEANLGDGIFPTVAYLAHQGAFGIGSDSNIEIGVAVELRQLEYAQRLSTRSRNVTAPMQASCGRGLFDAAAKGGARALQRQSGVLAPGACADILSLKKNSPHLTERQGDQLLDAWIFCAGARAVDCVWSGGRKLVSEGRHFARERIEAKFTRTMRAIYER